MVEGEIVLKRKISWILLVLWLMQIVPFQQAAFATPQAKPENVMIKEVGGEPSIGYDPNPQNLGYYADIQWEAPVFTGPYRYYDVYYKKNGETFQKWSSLPSSATETRLSELDSGTVYHTYVRAVHAHADDDPDYPDQIHASPVSEDDEVLFLTGIDLEVLPESTEEIQIIWDDVKYNQNRIGYRIYIAQSRDFATTSPIEVYPQDIGDSGVVKPISDNKLSYIVKNRRPGTVYYVKIVPIVYDQRIKVCPEQKIGIGYTYIPAAMNRVSAGDQHDIWKMEWARVTSSVSGTQETEYTIMQKEQGDLWQNAGGQKDVVRYIRVDHGEEDRFEFKVRVYIENETDQHGYPLYIESNVLSPYVSEVPYYPTIPDIRHTIPENLDEKIEIGKDNIKILWYLPKDPNGMRDDSIYYDFWITTDPTELDDPDTPPTISDFQPSEPNYIYEKIGDSLTDYMVAYKYVFEDLEPNTVYYIKMIAKKKFLINVGGSLTQVYYASDPAIEMILTDSDDINIPIAPARPPFAAKKNASGIPEVTETSATVEWKTGWYEIKDDDTGEWVPYSEQEFTGSVTDYVYREIQYDANVKFGIGYIELTEALDDYSFIRDEPLQITDIANPYGDTHQIMEYTIEDLEPNKMYLVWLRAYRDINHLSEPSNPIIVTTDFDYTVPLEKPAVPRWIRAVALDNNEGIELEWDRTTERVGLQYRYYLKWAEQDNIESAGAEVEIPSTYFDMTDVYLVEDVEPETTYYFWIRSEVENDEGEMRSSDWSDSKVVQTTEYVAPDTPTGFGIKNAPDAVGKDYITYEWNMEEDMDYALEISTNTEYEDAQVFTISAAGEYKVTGLASNKRYYARLYAIDRETMMLSHPTHTVSVKTTRSDDDYDTDTDNERVIEGPFIEDSYDKNTGEWREEIIGVNADRFLEEVYTDHFLDYKIDMSDPPSSYRRFKYRKVRVAYRVFEGLSQQKENLIIDIGTGGKFTIRPHMLALEEQLKSFDHSKEVIVDLIFDDSVSTAEVFQANINPVKMVQVDIEMKSGNSVVPITRLNRPLEVVMDYRAAYRYHGEAIETAVVDVDILSNRWSLVPNTHMTSRTDNKGIVRFETKDLGKMGIVKKVDSWRFTDISRHWAREDIIAVFSKYNMKSIAEAQTRFRPEDFITVDDCTKFILDVLDVDYDTNNYLQTAFKAGFMRLVKNKQNVSRQEVVTMLVRLYEIKTGEAAEIINMPITQYSDASEIGSAYVPILRFAVQKGFVIGKTADILAPTEPVTRAEVITMLKRTLEAIGEM